MLLICVLTETTIILDHSDCCLASLRIELILFNRLWSPILFGLECGVRGSLCFNHYRLIHLCSFVSADVRRLRPLHALFHLVATHITPARLVIFLSRLAVGTLVHGQERIVLGEVVQLTEHVGVRLLWFPCCRHFIYYMSVEG